MLEKLNAISKHYEDLGQLLLQVGADYQRAAQLNKERADLEAIVSRSAEYRQALKNLEQARSILAADQAADAELRALAEADIEALTPQIETLEREIKRLLVPRDARDEKNVIVEIRAGTGGDEAALFAADLFRMYIRFAELPR